MTDKYKMLYWRPTNRLCFLYENRVKTLRQLWVSEDGHKEWRKVPVLDAEKMNEIAKDVH